MLPSHGDLLVSLYKCSPSRRDAQRLLDQLRTELGAPPKGELVGSTGPDWSFRLALIWHSEGGTTGKRLFPTRGIIQQIIHPNKTLAIVDGHVCQQRMSYARHHYLDTVAVNKTGVLKWTRWARSIGLRHDGNWSYEFPPKRVWNTQPETLGLMTKYASRPLGKRSVSSKKERKARRATLQAVRHQRSVFDPVIESPSIPAKTIRKQWFSMDPRPKWSAFKADYEPKIHRVLKLSTVDVRKQTLGLSPIVLLSLKKIYSSYVVYEIPKPGKPFPTRSETIPVLELDMDAHLRSRLEEIELNGFKEPLAWYNIYHSLYGEKV